MLTYRLYFFRVEVSKLQWLADVNGCRIKSLLLDKIYSKCLFFIEQLKAQARKFDAEIVTPLNKLCLKTGKLLTKVENNMSEHVKTMIEWPTVEHLALKVLVERSIEIDLAIRLQSDKIWTALQKLSTIDLKKIEKRSDDGWSVSAEKVDKIFVEPEILPVSEKADNGKSVEGILNNFHIGDSSKSVFCSSDQNCVGVLSSKRVDRSDDSDDSTSIQVVGQMVKTKLK